MCVCVCVCVCCPVTYLPVYDPKNIRLSKVSCAAMTLKIQEMTQNLLHHSQVCNL